MRIFLFLQPTGYTLEIPVHIPLHPRLLAYVIWEENVKRMRNKRGKIGKKKE
jgi:hypothetical protein